LDALLTLGRLHDEAGRIEEALILYQQATEKEAYLEEAHLAIIRCYAQRRQRSRALRQYEHLTLALAELGATPSPDTQALIERLRSNPSP
jgi:DNA-binding SARP family transcriptional activator